MLTKTKSPLIAVLLLFLATVAIAQPTNDACSGATALGTLVPDVQKCQSGTNVLATPDLPYSSQTGCQPSGNTANPALDVWYTVTTPVNANQLVVSMNGAMPSINFSIYTGACGTLVPVACAISPNSNLAYTFGPGQIVGNTTYYIQISGNTATDAGAFNLCLTALIPPANDSCANAVTFGTLINNSPACLTGSNANATPELPYVSQNTCYPTGNMPNPSNDVWYTVTTPATADELSVKVNTTLTALNVGLYTGTCGGLTPVACGRSTSGSFSHLYGSQYITPNTTYYIQVSGGSVTDTGSFTICLKSNKKPVNDACIDAQVISLLPPGNQVCTQGSNIGANPEFPYQRQYACTPTGNSPSIASDVWYTITMPPGSNQLKVEISGTLLTNSVNVYSTVGSGGCGQLSGAGCIRSNVPASEILTGTQGTVFYIQVSGKDDSDVGNFNLCLTPIQDNTLCVDAFATISQTVISPLPIDSNGTYAPGTTMQFCLRVDSFRQVATNYFSGVELLPGPGWDPSTFQVISTPASCDGYGVWGFYNSVTSSQTGLTAGPGFYYDSRFGPLGVSFTRDGNPGNNYGDGSGCLVYPWVFCWQYTSYKSVTQGGTPLTDPCSIQNQSSPNNPYSNLSMGVKTYSDGQIGGWDNPGCDPDLPFVNRQIVQCCPQPDIVQHNPTCAGVANGSITATGKGTPPFTYTWDNGETSGTITGLAAGTYTVTVTDVTLCTAIKSVILTGGSNTLTTDSVDVSCNGKNNGKAFVTVTGSAGPFNYVWNTVPPQTSDTAFFLPPGTYVVTVTLPGGCSIKDSTTIHEPTVLTALKDSVNINCFGGSNGTATVNVSGGTPFPPLIPGGPTYYTYAWSTTPVQSTATATGLPAGINTVTITDANGCTLAETFQLTQPPAIVASVTTDSVKCKGDNTGSATLSFTGGLAPFSYAWNTNPVQTTATATGLTAGTYTGTITDANGCQFTGTANVGEPALLVVTGTNTNNICFGATTATGTANVTGGVQPYVYSWNSSPTQTTATATGLGANNYTVTVTDAKGCIQTANITVTEPTEILTTITSDSAKCFGSLDGTVTIAPTGGTPGYTYNWSTAPPQTTATVTGLLTGTYFVTVTDANNCTVTNNVDVLQPALIEMILDADSVVCNGGSTGKAWTTVTGGSGAYAYAWNTVPAQTTDTAFNLTAGTWTVSVTDAHNCLQTGDITVDQPDALAATAVIDSVNCFGGSDGSIMLTATGGIAPYTYLWSNGAVTKDITGLPTGPYDVTVTDFNSCTFVVTGLQVLQPALLTATANGDSVKCATGNTGKAWVTVTGGTPVYSYIWSPGPSVNSDTLRNLIANTYGITVTDKYGCSAASSVQIFEPLPLATIAGADSVKCFGGNTGKAYVGASGGVTPYTYNWSAIPVQHTDTAFNLTANLYKVTVTDAKGCTITNSVNVYQPTVLTIAVNRDSVLCYGGSTGKVWATVGGGIAPYNYTWNGGPPNSDTLPNVPIGSYTVLVTDANGCTISGTKTVEQPLVLALAAQIDSVKCNAGSTGRITLTIVTGGTQPYTYAWSNGGTTRRIENLSAGTYSVTVTDAKGCTADLQNLQVLEPAQIVASVASVDSVKCHGQFNGAIHLTTTGGTPPYYYLWSNNAPGVSDPSNLAAGTYTVEVSDKYFCAVMVTATVGEPAPIDVAVTFDSIKCYKGTGNINLTVTGANAPYSYNWSNGATSQNNIGVVAGGYTATITDSKGCDTVVNYILAQPDSVMQFLKVQYPTNCPYPLVSVPINDSVYGGTKPYSFAWSNGDTGPTATATTYDHYSVTMTDAKGCIDTAGIDLVKPDSLFVVVTPNNTVCFGDSNGSAQATVNGGFGGYTYTWNNGNSTSSSIISNLPGGHYTLTVTDKQGCVKDTFFDIAERPEVTVTIDSTILLEIGKDTILSPIVTGLVATDTVTYTWTPSNGLSCTNCLTPVVTPLDSMLYFITVNVNGCKVSDSIYVRAGLEHVFYAPSAFSPNGDDKNDFYSFYGYGIRRIEFTIANRWGDIVFEGHNINDIWDGTTRGDQAAAGVYVYTLYVEFDDRYNFRKKGTITLIR